MKTLYLITNDPRSWDARMIQACARAMGWEVRYALPQTAPAAPETPQKTRVPRLSDAQAEAALRALGRPWTVDDLAGMDGFGQRRAAVLAAKWDGAGRVTCDGYGYRFPEVRS